MTSIRMRTLCAATSLLALAAISSPAFAQDQAADNSNAGDIVVTANRTSQKLLDVPLSIVAQSGEQLQTNGIKQITDLQFTTPGYNVSDSNGYTQVFIRGIGNAEFVGADPSVTTFIDDVPRIYGSMVNNFVDVDRVEVLKGAQGGLYGRNATGGVINIISKQPSTDKPEIEGRVSYGEKNTFEGAAYINVPLSDQLAISVSGERRSSDPYYKNTAASNPFTAAMFPGIAAYGGVTFLPTGPGGSFAANTPAQTAAFFNAGVNNSDVGNQNFWAVDGKILFKPTSNFKITIAGDYSSKNDSQGNGQFETSPAYLLSQYVNTLGEFGVPFNTSAPGVANLVGGNNSKFTVSNGDPGFVRLFDWGLSATAVLSTDKVDFTSITAYRAQHTQFIDDLDSNAVPQSAAFVDNHKHFFYEELRAVSHFSGPFQFIAGGSYLSNWFQGYTDVPLLGSQTNNFFTLPTARSQDVVHNWSLYLQATYNLTDKLSLTASGRYIHETNTATFFDLANADVVPFANPTGAPVSSLETKFIPAATLSYKLDGGGNIYVRWARGFKSGGVNPVANASAFVINGTYYASSGSIFQGETVDTFEGGYKGQFLDNKVQFTADVFYNNYKNLQTAGHVNADYASSIILTIINAPSARTYGVEGTLNWHATPALNLGVNAGYLNAKYKDFNIPQSGPANAPILSAFDLSGTQMPNSPQFQISFTADLKQPINDHLSLVGNVLVTHSSSTLWQVSGNPCGPGGIVNVTCLPNSVGNAYWLVNARIGIKSQDDHWGLSVYANNLFNAAYTTYGNSNAAGSTLYTWGNPRIVGVEATFKY